MSEITHKSGLTISDKEYKEQQVMFGRMADGSYDDKARSKNEKK